MKLVAGSYERFLWGYDVNTRTRELNWKFAYPAHQGPVKCVATCGAVVATGGADDTIRVFDLNAHKDMGALYQHQGAVTCLAFHNSHPLAGNHPTHLLSGAEDGAICIWDTEAWVHLVTMKAKKGPKAPVLDLSIHTSGLLALSIERNCSMKMWNLTKGRCSFTTKLPQAADVVNFFPQAGESYALALGNVMEIRNAETGNTIHRLQHDKRIFCMAQRQDNILVTGGEDCMVKAWDTRSGKQAWVMENAHTNRVKGVAILGSQSDAGDESGEVPHLVASASSDGLLKVWDTRMVTTGCDGEERVPLMQAETKARLTCLVCSSSGKRTPAPESLPAEGDVVVGKQQPSSAKPGQFSTKKERKAGAHGGEIGEEDDDKSLSGKKRPKKQVLQDNATKSPPRPKKPSTTTSPSSKALGKRPNREKSQQGGTDGAPPLNHSKHKKHKKRVRV